MIGVGLPTRFTQRVMVNGNLRWIENYVVRFREGTRESWFGLARDVTHRINQEDALQQALATAHESARLKSEFLANMNHELRTPLNAVLGFAEILSQRGLPAEEQQFLSNILRSGQLLLQLINDILDLSKLEVGKLELSPKAHALSDLADDLRGMFVQRAQAKELEFRVEQDEGPNLVKLDSLRLQQVLVNLINNGLKFTERGFVNVRIRPQGAAGEVGTLQISVQDSGIGIPAAQQAQVFQPFAQARGVNHQQHGGGTGLGLSISESLVKAMGGAITLESTVGEGSCFTVTLPRVAFLTDDAAAATTTQATVRFEPATLLVVDDLALHRKVLVKTLESHPELTVLAASSSAEAAPLLQEHNVALVWLDLRLRHEHGVEIARRWRRAAWGKDLLLISYTTDPISDAEEAALFNAQLTKPALYEDLRDLLMQLLPHSVSAPTTDANVGEPQPRLTAAQQERLRERLQTEVVPQALKIKRLDSQQKSALVLSLQQLAQEYPSPVFQAWVQAVVSDHQATRVLDMRRRLLGIEQLLAELERELG